MHDQHDISSLYMIVSYRYYIRLVSLYLVVATLNMKKIVQRDANLITAGNSAVSFIKLSGLAARFKGNERTKQ